MKHTRPLIAALLLSPIAALTAAELPKTTRPNIIVIMTDDQRWDSLGCYGDKVVKTPNLDALAKEGTRFENAFSCAMLCCPSRTSFFTGKYPSHNECYYNNKKSEIGDANFPSSSRSRTPATPSALRARTIRFNRTIQNNGWIASWNTARGEKAKRKMRRT